MNLTMAVALLLALAFGLRADPAAAQPLGTFRWQLQPYCNVLTVTITQVGSVYRLEGRDDQCGAARAASVIGTAAQNPDGTIGLGFNIVSAPAGVAQPVSAAISLASLSGTWLGTGASGPFVFTPGAGTGGAPRPAPSTGGGGTVIPAAFRLESDGGLVASGTFGQGSLAPAGAGTRLVWNPRKAGFRAGAATTTAWDDDSIGTYSVGFGVGTVASGRASTAMGENTVATAAQSFAAGLNSSARNTASTALGRSTRALGYASTTLGDTTEANGDASTAMGQQSVANGAYSLAAGLGVVTRGNASVAVGRSTSAWGPNSFAGGRESVALSDESLAFGRRASAEAQGSVVLGSYGRTEPDAFGSFVYSDLSSASAFVSFDPNQFLVRAAGGVGFYTSAGATSGVELAPNGSQWLVVSDVATKRAFRSLDGEEVLGKLARMPIQEWSYKTQDSAIRHVGPTAQDFSAAFGLGEDPLRIGTMDADGIALRAIQALEVRTQSLLHENRQLRERLAELEARMVAALGAAERR